MAEVVPRGVPLGEVDEEKTLGLRPDGIDLRTLSSALVKNLGRGSYKEDPEIFNAVQQCMEAYDENYLDWKRFELWVQGRYSRNLIARPRDTFALMLLCWPAGKFSPIHDHGGSECWLKVLRGEITEKFYKVPDLECEDLQLEELFVKTHGAGSVAFINDQQGLHAIGNAGSEGAITLHCYVPGYDECHAYMSTKNVQANMKTCYMTFDSIHGDKVAH